MYDPTTVSLLRLLHIVGGLFWVGAVVFMGFFLIPSLRAVGPAGGAVMHQITRVRRLPLWVMAAMLVTLLSGGALYWRGAARTEWMMSGPGLVFGIGGLFALMAAILGMAVNVPTVKRLGAVGAAMQAAGGAPPADLVAEATRLQRRLAIATQIAAVLLLIATAAMAVARYTG